MAEPTKRSGNGWGGARLGAGRKPSPMSGYAPASNPQRVRTRDPLKFLLQVMQGKFKPTRSQMRAATAVLPYVHARAAATGKKTSAQSAAHEAVAPGGKFAPRVPAEPLRVVEATSEG